MISVFLDFRVYKGSVNTEIKEHGDHLKILYKQSNVQVIQRFEAQLR